MSRIIDGDHQIVGIIARGLDEQKIRPRRDRMGPLDISCDFTSPAPIGAGKLRSAAGVHDRKTIRRRQVKLGIKDIKITRTNGVWQMEANYDDQAPLFANMFILVTFDKTVKLKNGGGG